MNMDQARTDVLMILEDIEQYHRDGQTFSHEVSDMSTSRLLSIVEQADRQGFEIVLFARESGAVVFKLQKKASVNEE
ncbi:MAG: hypothetical protein VB104_06995 [Candidatus Limiplasma sp.]|nr:hypothetical protein [Candidatus Limiplasma sp.]